MKTVSIVISVYNERRTIADVLDRVRMAPTLGLQKDLVVVDDSSKDGTAEYLRGLSSDHLLCLFYDRNRGKGQRSGQASLGPPAISSSSRMPTLSTTRKSIRSSFGP